MRWPGPVVAIDEQTDGNPQSSLKIRGKPVSHGVPMLGIFGGRGGPFCGQGVELGRRGRTSGLFEHPDATVGLEGKLLLPVDRTV